MLKKNVTSEVLKDTIDNLAIKIAKGFSDVTEKMATKTDIKILDSKITKLENKIDTMVLTEYKRRIEKLETEMKELKAMLAM